MLVCITILLTVLISIGLCIMISLNFIGELLVQIRDAIHSVDSQIVNLGDR